MTGNRPVLTMTGISKTFPGVRALHDVDFRLFPGEVHALMGENGAGKSTLIKVLTGVYGTDAGVITLDGEQVSFSGPMQAAAAGVSTVYQEVNLCTNLSVAENVFIGREPRRLGAVRWGEMRRRARDLLVRLDLDLDVAAPLGTYSLAVQQMVAIARAIDVRARVLILDEPTSSLDAGEVAQLFRIMRQLRDEGIAILFVTHFLDQVYGIADRITVLRNGTLVGEYRTEELPQFSLVEKMIGQELDVLERLDEQQKRTTVDAGGEAPLVDAAELGRRGAVAPFSLRIHAGEVVGLAGLLGSGRTEVARLIFGADRADHGQVRLDGGRAPVRNPIQAIGQGVGFCSENRRAEGIVPELTVRENMILAMQAARGWLRPIPRRRQDELVRRYVEALSIRPANPELPVRNLSGGNQQKVLFARALGSDADIILMDDPMRGVDIGTKQEVYGMLRQEAAAGRTFLWYTTEMDELKHCDRVYVFRNGRIVDELSGHSITEERVLHSSFEAAA